MLNVLDEPAQLHDRAATQRLRTTTAAMRLSFTWFGVRKTLSAEQKAQAASSFGAEGDFLSAGKKLIDTRDAAFRACTSVRSQATSFFRGVSLPFPEPGIRLIRHIDLEEIAYRMRLFKEDLDKAVRRLDERFDALKSSARERLGELYNEADYPSSLIGLFDLAWDFPSIEPPDYLRRLNPEIYQQECQRVQARFNEAVQLAEQAFTEELAKLVEHLTERLTGQQDGAPKVFRDSAVDNLTDFFGRFQLLNIRSSEALDELVEQAQNIVRGVQPQQLRDDGSLRQRVATQMAAVQANLDQLLVDRPRRNILRRPR